MKKLNTLLREEKVQEILMIALGVAIVAALTVLA
jgi:hypothetical protein